MQFNKDKMQAKHFLQKVMLGSYIVPHRIWQTMNMNMNSVSAWAVKGVFKEKKRRVGGGEEEENAAGS